MGMQNFSRALRGATALRGVQSVRAEGNPGFAEVKGMIEDVNKAFAAFKEANNKNLKDRDVVQEEKVERINSDLGKMQEHIDEVVAQLGAVIVGGSADETNPDAKAHATAFDRMFRKGIDNGLADLEVKAGLRSSSDPDGGWLVPEETENTIDRVQSTVSAMRGICRVMSISTDTYKKLVNLGGAGYGWIGEAEARPETNTPTLAELAFPTMELYANPAATQAMLDDSRVDIAQWLGEEVSVVFAEAEGAAFISGTGVKQPRGLLSYDTLADASWAWGSLGFKITGVAADINDGGNNGVDGLIDLVYALKQGFRTNARFIMNRALASKVRKLKTIGDNAEYLWQPSTQVGQPATLLGYPITDDDNMPNVGAGAFPVAFGDFQRGYLIVDRIGIRVLRDPFTNKPYVHFYTTKRVGGGVQNFEAIKLWKCST